MKNIYIIYYMINYVICDTCFAIEMGFRRLLPPYQLYKISEWLNYAKGIRVLGRFIGGLILKVDKKDICGRVELTITTQ